MKKRKSHPPAYVDGSFLLYDLVDTTEPDAPDAPIRKIKPRAIGEIYFTRNGDNPL